MLMMLDVREGKDVFGNGLWLIAPEQMWLRLLEHSPV